MLTICVQLSEAHGLTAKPFLSDGLSSNSIRSEHFSGSNFPDHIVSLMYDDGPDFYSYDLATYLHDQHVNATFNVVGNFREEGSTGYLTKKPINHLPNGVEYLQALTHLGHRIGNHTLNHLPLLSQCPRVESVGGSLSPCAGNGAAIILKQLKENNAHISQYVTNNFFTFTPPGFGWSDSIKELVASDAELRNIIGPVGAQLFNPIANHFGVTSEATPSSSEIIPNTNDWQYAESHISPVDFASDFLLWADGVRHGNFLLHDRNKFDVSGSYALTAAKIIIPALKEQGYVFVAPIMQFSDFVHTDGTFKTDDNVARQRVVFTVSADINGDGYSDICLGFENEIACSLVKYSFSLEAGISPSIVFEKAQVWRSASFKANKNSNINTWQNIRLTDMNNDKKADLLYSNSKGIWAEISTGKLFKSKIQLLKKEYTVENMNAPIFHVGDINGDGIVDICLLETQNIGCYLLDKKYKAIQKYVVAYANTVGEMQHQHFFMSDINGDGKEDVLFMSNAGLNAALSTGEGFNAPVLWKMSNSNDFASEADLKAAIDSSVMQNQLYFADINGDKKSDMCFYVDSRIECALSNGRQLLAATQWIGSTSHLTEKNTLIFSDINGDGRADVMKLDGYNLFYSFAP